jgi:outer membrane protein assembly factor BamB
MYAFSATTGDTLWKTSPGGDSYGLSVSSDGSLVSSFVSDNIPVSIRVIGRN